MLRRLVHEPSQPVGLFVIHVALLRATAKHPEQAAASARTVRSTLVSYHSGAQHGKETGCF